MVSIKRGIYYLINNRSLFCDSIVKNFLFFLPDKLYISLRYRFQMGKWINWDNPETFTEKIQWLKIYNRKPEYATLVDKYEVKKYNYSGLFKNFEVHYNYINYLDIQFHLYIFHK